MQSSVHQRSTTVSAIAGRAAPMRVWGSLTAASNQSVLVRNGSSPGPKRQSDAVDLPE